MKNLLLTFLCLGFACTAFAQTSVTGNVTDNNGEAVIGATVLEQGTTNGTITDIDGNFSLSVSLPNATLAFSYIGYLNQTVALGGKTHINVVLQEDSQVLQEVVAIGYGTATKEKLTGAVASVGQKDLNKGLATNPMSLISGKVAGVNITPSSGRAGDGNRIRIRGGASLAASNDPLIVIDGLPVSNDGISGQTNALSSLNPNDIESMTILKDASATAIYGSRASNGVIIITTKKGTGSSGGGNGRKVKLEVSSTNSIATVARQVNVLSGDEIKKLVEDYTGYTSVAEKARYIGYLGYTENGVKKYANTDWQKEIYRSAFSSDNNFSISGKVPHLPYRVSAGYLTQDGLLKTDNIQRVTGAITLNPTFFKGDLLNININLKGSWTKSHFGNDDAISAALRMDPTKPVTVSEGMEKYNNYWQWGPSLATENPVSVLNKKRDIGTAGRAFGNIQVDYKMHFCPDLRANVNVGFDYANGKGYTEYAKWDARRTGTGEYKQYDQTRFDLLLEAYLAYAKDFGKHHFDIMGGYTYQSWLKKGPNFNTYYYDRETISGEPITFPNYKDEHVLISFYGRVNYGWADKYLLQASIRTDASSRFGLENRWGWFPAASAAWIISKENFLKNSKAVSNLKLRLGWGMTGQQDGIGNYEYLSRYGMSTNTAMVQFGDTYYYMWRPEGYDPDRRWEATTTYNAGLDYGFLKGKIYGAIDVYYKHTTDLLSNIPIPLGSNFSNFIVKNIGSMNNKGVEFSINYVPVDKDDWTVDIGLNVTYNKSKITKLTLNDADPSAIGYLAGGTSLAGVNVQINSVGYTPYSFYVYEQIYDADGKPIEGEFKDQDGNGSINENDLIYYKQAEPKTLIGLNANIRWKQLTFSTSLRSSLGNYLYNNANSDMANYSQILNTVSYIQNTTVDIYNTSANSRNMQSSYYVQNASFLKMDYVSLSYDFAKLVKKVNLALNFTVQNVFCITKYTGIDPEIAGGIDNKVYPYPRTFSLGIKLTY